MLFKKKVKKPQTIDIERVEKSLEKSRNLNKQMFDLSVVFLANTDKMLATQNVRRS